MNELFRMNVFESSDDLATDHDNSFECEFFVAFLKQILNARSKHVHHHYVICLVFAVIVDLGDTVLLIVYRLV